MKLPAHSHHAPNQGQSESSDVMQLYEIFFPQLKLKYLATSLILRRTVKNVALELGPSERKIVLLSLLKFSFCP